MVEFQIIGDKELKEAIKRLPDNIQRNVIRGGVRVAGVALQRRALDLVPVGPANSENARLYGGYRGALRDSIRITTRFRNGVMRARVIAGGKNKKSGADVFYAHIVEGGSQPHEIRPKGHKSLFFAGIFAKVIQHPGTKPTHFMKRSLEGGAQAAVNAFGNYARRRLAKLAP